MGGVIIQPVKRVGRPMMDVHVSSPLIWPLPHLLRHPLQAPPPDSQSFGDKNARFRSSQIHRLSGALGRSQSHITTNSFHKSVLLPPLSEGITQSSQQCDVKHGATSGSRTQMAAQRCWASYIYYACIYTETDTRVYGSGPGTLVCA